MAKTAEMKVSVASRTDNAVQLTFYEGDPEEVTEWVPLSVIEDAENLEEENLKGDAEATVNIAKWFLQKKNIPYEG